MNEFELVCHIVVKSSPTKNKATVQPAAHRGTTILIQKTSLTGTEDEQAVLHLLFISKPAIIDFFRHLGAGETSCEYNIDVQSPFNFLAVC